MKTITTSDECAACRACCQFRAGKLYFAPLWTDDEVRHLQTGSPETAQFHPFDASGRVFQIGLVPSTLKEDVWVCPLLDEPSNMCRVYGLHPFDCRIWPFLVTRDPDGAVRLVYVADPDCRGMRRACADGGDELKSYARYLEGYLRRPEVVATLRAHPELIWPTQPNTVPLADLSDVLK